MKNVALSLAFGFLLIALALRLALLNEMIALPSSLDIAGSAELLMMPFLIGAVSLLGASYFRFLR
jgi:hypothetical protein